MVLLLQNRVETIGVQGHPAELMLESGRVIRYVAAKDANPRAETRAVYDENDVDGHHHPMRTRKSSFYTPLDETDDWEGVNALCQVLDTIVDVEAEHDFMDGKSALEIGYATGLPAIFALESGASDVAIHCPNKATLDGYVRATMRRNTVAPSQLKLTHGDVAECAVAICGKKFDVIFAPEVLNCPKEQYEAVHDLLDQALANDGICFLTSRLTYFNSSGSLPEFLALIKLRRTFVPLVRWTSPASDIVPRQVIQLTRNLAF